MPGAPSAPRQRPKSCARSPSAAHASFLSQPDDKHVRPAWRSLRAPQRPAFARGFVRRRRGRRNFTGARHVCSHLEQLRKRYAEDQEFRQKKIAYACAYQKAHKAEIRERRRRRRETDPAYRQKLLAAAQAYYEAHKEELTEDLRRRRQTDPEYRDKLLARERKQSRARDPMSRRKHRLRCIYRISLEEYDAMLNRQGGVCAICKKKPDEGKVLFVDHCHVTGQVRGLLCHKCNSVLAFGNDDPDILSAAIAYLQAACDRDRNVTRRDTAGASGRGKLAVGRKSLPVRPNPKLPTAAVI
jgi:Recombination endonuclease VII